MKGILLNVRKQKRKPRLCFHLSPKGSIMLVGIDEIEVGWQDGLIIASPSKG